MTVTFFMALWLEDELKNADVTAKFFPNDECLRNWADGNFEAVQRKSEAILEKRCQKSRKVPAWPGNGQSMWDWELKGQRPFPQVRGRGGGVGRGFDIMSWGSLERTLGTRVVVGMKKIYRIHISLSNSRHTRSKIRKNVWLVLDLIRFLDWKIKMKKSDWSLLKFPSCLKKLWIIL